MTKSKRAKDECVGGKIRITQTPDGEAPLLVREQWVGLILPIVGISNTMGKGVVTGKNSDSEPAYMVLQKQAIKRLAAESKMAAQWFTRRGFPQHSKACFGFKISKTALIGTLKQRLNGQFVGLLEVGVGAHDHWANQR